MKNFVIFDVETSGLNHKEDRVIELAAIRIEKGDITKEFSAVINPKMDKPLAPKITEITGITQTDIDNGMEEQEAFDMLRSMITEDTILVAHNASFDIQFLHYTYTRLYGDSVQNPIIDTLTISRARHVYPHKLENMCERYNIPLVGAHRALNDVVGCWKLLEALHKEESITKWINQIGYLKKYGPPEWSPDYVKQIPMVNKYA